MWYTEGMSETREAYTIGSLPATPDDAEAIRQKLTELVPLVSWRVEVLAGEFWIVGNVVVSGNLINVGYSMIVSEFHHIQKHDQWNTWGHILTDVLAKAIMKWRPNAAGECVVY